MRAIEDIADLPEDAVELLEAIGYLDVHEFCEAEAEDLVGEISKANEALAIVASNPDAETIKGWQEICSSAPEVEPPAVGGEPEDDADDDAEEHPELVNFEDDPEVLEMLETAPVAELLPVELIKRNKLAVGDIPEAILLTECSPELDINVLTNDRVAKHQRHEADAKRTGLMVSRIRSFDQADNADHHVKPLDKGAPREVTSVSQGLNAGISPESRRFVRGVMHPDPWKVRTSAFFAILVQLLLAGNFIALPILLLDKSNIWWVVGLACALVLAALGYLIWGISSRCRVCGQRQFAPKKCLKNKKAHRIPLIGYIFPTALHAIFFKWFYCTYCGTAVRLKK